MALSLFDSFMLGDLPLANRMVMAPLTRNRADYHGVATALMATHYRQRAQAGLIVTESTPISAQAVGYPCTPGLYAEAHIEGWRQVTDAVHEADGIIFVQLQHCGRISHPSFQPDNGLPVSASAIRPEGQAVTYQGKQDFVVPHALAMSEIPAVVAQFRRSAEMARAAGFDGVEIHGANGYLIDQFLRDGSNHRRDIYGGTLENRMRFLDDILDAVLTVWPANRIGVRLSPENSFNSMADSNPQAHFESIVASLSKRALAYLHVLEGDMMSGERALDYGQLRSKYEGCMIANNGYDLDRAQAALAGDRADLIAFGRPFLANPDLVRRFREGLPLNQVDPTTFYGGGEKGYNDYPVYDQR